MYFTLADLVIDITQNAIESGARLVELEIEESNTEFRFLVRDNGKGMTKEEISRAIDPFVTDGVKHPHRKVGLGIPFLIQCAEQSGGGWNAESEKGKGTTATAWFNMENVDTPPVGDLPGTFRNVLMFQGPDDIVIRRLRQTDGQGPVDYEVRKSDLVEVLGDLEESGSLILLGKYLHSLEENDL